MNERLLHTIDQYGVFLRRDALEIGYDERSIASMLRRKEWHRVRHGAYTMTSIWDAAGAVERHAIVSAAVLRASKTGMVLSHASAAALLGAPLWDLDLTEVHVTRLDHRSGRREAGVRQHQGVLLPEDLTTVTGRPVTSATRTALDVTTVTDVEHALVTVDGLLHAGLTTPEDLAKRYSSMTRWPFTLRTGLVLRLADGRSESVGETRTRHLCWTQGLPAPDLQVPVTDINGHSFAWVDMAWPELGVFLEFDGRIKYGRLLKPGQQVEDVVYREKQREDRIREVTQWRCIRVTWADLNRPKLLAARIRQVLHPSQLAG